MISFSPKAPTETAAYVFDFVSSLATGETISTATCTASVFSGLDATPSGIISGVASISGTKATQKLTGGVNGTIYKVMMTITTSTSNTLVLSGYVAVTTNPL